MVEGCLHDMNMFTWHECNKFTWNKPWNHWIKLNTDGSALSNPGILGAGGILENSEGDLIMA